MVKHSYFSRNGVNPIEDNPYADHINPAVGLLRSVYNMIAKPCFDDDCHHDPLYARQIFIPCDFLKRPVAYRAEAALSSH